MKNGGRTGQRFIGTRNKGTRKRSLPPKRSPKIWISLAENGDGAVHYGRFWGRAKAE